MDASATVTPIVSGDNARSITELDAGLGRAIGFAAGRSRTAATRAGIAAGGAGAATEAGLCGAGGGMDPDR